MKSVANIFKIIITMFFLCQLSGCGQMLSNIKKTSQATEGKKEVTKAVSEGTLEYHGPAPILKVDMTNSENSTVTVNMDDKIPMANIRSYEKKSASEDSAWSMSLEDA